MENILICIVRVRVDFINLIIICNSFFLAVTNLSIMKIQKKKKDIKRPFDLIFNHNLLDFYANFNFLSISFIKPHGYLIYDLREAKTVPEP